MAEPMIEAAKETPAEQKSYAADPIKLSAEKEKLLISTVVKNYDNTTNSPWYQQKGKDWDEYHKMYMGVTDPSSFPWNDASNLDLGIVEMSVDNIKSRFKISTIGAKPMFNTIPLTEKGEESKQKVTDSMNVILETDIDAEERVDTISLYTTKYGTCVAKLYWKRDLIEKKDYQSIGDLVYPVDSNDIEEHGCVDVVDLKDFVIPENADKDVTKIPWMYHRVWYSVFDLEKKVKLGHYSREKVDQIKAALVDTKDQKTRTPEEQLELSKKMSEEKVEILECYMRFQTTDELLEKECIFWVCPKTSTLIKGFYLKDIYFNGRRPFYVFRYKETGGFYGRGLPEMLKPYRKLINDTFNYATNCLMLQILPWGFYRIGSSFKPEEVRLSPGVMIPVDDVNDVRIAQFPVNAQAAEGFVKLLMSFIERQTGISSPSMGKEFPTRKTATEVKTIISEGNVKHEDRIQVFQRVFSDLLKGIYQLYRQNQASGRKERLKENEEDYKFVNLFSHLDQLPDYDFVILGTLTTGNKAVERDDTMQLYAIATQNPLIGEYPIGQLELLKEVFNVFGKRNSKRFLPPDNIIQAVTQAKMAQVQQGMQQMQQDPSVQMNTQPRGPAQGQNRGV